MRKAPQWCAFRWDGLVAIVNDLIAKGEQGRYLIFKINSPLNLRNYS